MQTGSNYATPVVESINVKTYREQEDNTLYASRILRYSKDEYSDISTIFPVEDFPGNAECYYLFFIGNEWLYSYKNGKIVKVVETAPELLEDMKENWLSIKQNGMTQKELRSVPADDLNKLMLNPDYANSEFGIIYVLKTDDVSTQDYQVQFKLKLNKKYFGGNENLTLKIALSGSEEKLFTPEDITTEEIEKFMSWISNRQNGKGSIFYQINTKTGFYFLNYFMITGVDVLKEQVN